MTWNEEELPEVGRFVVVLQQRDDGLVGYVGLVGWAGDDGVTIKPHAHTETWSLHLKMEDLGEYVWSYIHI